MLNGKWLSARSPAKLIAKLLQNGVADATAVRIADGESYLQYLSLSAAEKALAVTPARELAPPQGDLQTRKFEHLRHR